eukprot:scaffold58985_cov53-Phaeocystis_antarctica.AAC.2
MLKTVRDRSRAKVKGRVGAPRCSRLGIHAGHSQPQRPACLPACSGCSRGLAALWAREERPRRLGTEERQWRRSL